ncbi:MAG: hypothetical protein EBY98_06650 [Acidimicrobiia bacterium]|nr:hypothetical protein [Acidimicrobiia bacterium]
MNDSPRDSLRVFAVSLVLAFSLFALWSQLTPLGAAPDEASHYVKAAAVVRGEWIGEPLDGWRIAVEGWAYSDTSTIAEVILLDSDGSVLARSAPNVVREDVNAALQLPVDAKIGFDLSLVSSERREPAAAVALLNDGTLAGFRHVERPIFSVQYHPEASPGPHDSSYLFDVFIELMRTRKPVERMEMERAQAALAAV